MLSIYIGSVRACVSVCVERRPQNTQRTAGTCWTHAGVPLCCQRLARARPREPLAVLLTEVRAPEAAHQGNRPARGLDRNDRIGPLTHLAGASLTSSLPHLQRVLRTETAIGSWPLTEKHRNPVLKVASLSAVCLMELRLCCHHWHCLRVAFAGTPASSSAGNQPY
jgi:hypothetical protein